MGGRGVETGSRRSRIRYPDMFDNSFIVSLILGADQWVVRRKSKGLIEYHNI